MHTLDIYTREQVFDGIQYLHTQGMIHRDLKPENVLMVGREPGTEEYMMLKICDFGLRSVCDVCMYACTCVGVSCASTCVCVSVSTDCMNSMQCAAL